MEDAPSYWSALFDDGSTELLDASNWHDAQDEADRKYGVVEMLHQDLVDSEED
jgi:hypothetical protein